MNNKHEVRSQFDEAAQVYDEQRRKLIPCFDDFYNLAVSLADVSTNTPRVLDLGAGTGLFSSLLLQKYPDARVTLIDLSENMLAIAKQRLQQFQNVTYLLDDYTNYEQLEGFDIIISSLSIHHLTDRDKQVLYRNTYSNLAPNGIFINADQVLGHTPFVDSLYKQDWRNKVEASGLSRAAIDSAYERTKLDRMTPLDVQLNWLQEIGFTNVDCVYKYFNFAVMYGRKSK